MSDSCLSILLSCIGFAISLGIVVFTFVINKTLKREKRLVRKRTAINCFRKLFKENISLFNNSSNVLIVMRGTNFEKIMNTRFWRRRILQTNIYPKLCYADCALKTNLMHSQTTGAWTCETSKFYIQINKDAQYTIKASTGIALLLDDVAINADALSSTRELILTNTDFTPQKVVTAAMVICSCCECKRKVDSIGKTIENPEPNFGMS